MKKSVFVVVSVALLAFAFIATPICADNDRQTIMVFVDGVRVDFADQEPIIADGRTLVPIRAIFETFGMEVEWLNEHGQQQIWAQKGDFAIQMHVGSHFMTFGTFADYYVTFRGQRMRPWVSAQIELDVPPQIVNDRTLVPLRAISEALNARVEWSEETRSVIITATPAD